MLNPTNIYNLRSNNQKNLTTKKRNHKSNKQMRKKLISTNLNTKIKNQSINPILYSNSNLNLFNNNSH